MSSYYPEDPYGYPDAAYETDDEGSAVSDEDGPGESCTLLPVTSD